MNSTTPTRPPPAALLPPPVAVRRISGGPMPLAVHAAIEIERRDGRSSTLHHSGLGIFRKSEIECRALVLRAFGPGTAAVARDNPPNDSQTDPRPLELCRRVETLEYSKESVGILRLETDSIVTHVKYRFLFTFACVTMESVSSRNIPT